MKPRIIKTIEVSQIDYVSIDEIFSRKARSVVEMNISDTDFNVVSFAEKMELSQSTLYRRVKELFDLSPQEYIHYVRLKHAERMLMKRVGRVSDIARAVGFNCPKYFTRCFKKCFGISPLDLLRREREKVCKCKKI